jgi:N-acetylmuramoyl-L-alanine amidase
MRVRLWLAVAAILAALPFVPLPRACDPRDEELPATRYGDLARFAGTRTRAEIEAALRLVDPSRVLAPYLTLTDAALEVRLAPGDGQPAVRVGLRATPAPARPRRYQRIALDPGHWGGTWSRLEQRHITVGDGPPVREGDLTWATARLLENDLRAGGAEVRVLRGPPPGADFHDGAVPGYDPGREARLWLGERRLREPPWLAPLWAFQLQRERRLLAGEDPFALYNHYELRRRAAAAEEFAADVTLSLHYDVTSSGVNGIAVFVPGNVLPGELETPSQRFWAVRRVLDGTLEEDLRLARALADALMRKLDLPALPGPGAGDAPSAWLPVDPGRGIYARNLAILRRAPGVALLLEGPCMNERHEYQRLQGTEQEVDGKRYPGRVRQYADAVLEGLRGGTEAAAGP